MNILLIIGDHPRHKYFADFISKHYDIKGMIIEKRENIIPDSSKIKILKDKKNFIRHFGNRNYYEKKFFKIDTSKEFTKKLVVTNINIEINKCLLFLEKIKPNLILLYGINFIKEPFFSSLPKLTINLHSGLAPYYKGSACNFWPFYFLQPNWSGFTFHFINKFVDMGNVIHHVLPTLEKGDTIHQVSCKGVILACNDSLKIIELAKKHGVLKNKKIKKQGKLFLNSDFKVEHLRLIYNMFNDDIVDYYLDRKINCNNPKLITI